LSPSRLREGLGEGLSNCRALADKPSPQPLPQAGGEQKQAIFLQRTPAQLPNLSPDTNLDVGTRTPLGALPLRRS